MNQSVTQNRRWVLPRPHGAPVAEKFPPGNAADPHAREGQVLLRTVWLSLDPYICGMSAPSYSPPVEIGAVMGAAR